jgi:hypothetical protein
MNRAIMRVFSSSSRLIPRIYASTKSTGTSATTETGHHGSGEVHHHDDHGHGHHHHHEPELRKTQEWSHHSGIQSKYENQGDDPSIAFMQGKTIYFMKTLRKNDLRLTNAG